MAEMMLRMSPLVSGDASDGDSCATSTSPGVEFFLLFPLPPLLMARLVRTRLLPVPQTDGADWEELPTSSI